MARALIGVTYPIFQGLLAFLGGGASPGRPMVNLAPPQECVVEVRRRATLGRFEDPLSVGIPEDAYVAEVPWGGWVVTEDGNDVIEYAPDGTFRSALGRRGEGPGELRTPGAVAVDPTDSTWVSDPRGRVVLFGPDGRPARTLLSPDLFQVEGFTTTGLPYAFLTKADRSSRDGSAWRYIQVWSREGEPLHQLGPAAFTPQATGSPFNEATQLQGVLLGDSVGVVPAGWRSWLTYWSGSAAWTSVPADSVWRALGLRGGPGSFSDGRPTAIAPDGEGGYWVTGAVRRLSESQEAALARGVRLPRGETMQRYGSVSAPVRNAVFDGALIHVTRAGAITGGILFEEYAWGFASPRQFYTFTETEMGLIQIHIWEFSRRCRRPDSEASSDVRLQ